MNQEEQEDNKSSNNSNSELEDEDLDLIKENMGQFEEEEEEGGRFKRLQSSTNKKKKKNTIDLMKVFEQDSSSEEDEDAQREDDVADFIEEDQELEQEINKKKKKKRKTPTTFSFKQSDDVVANELFELFGDGTEYDYAYEYGDRDEEQLDSNAAAANQENELKKIYEPSELKSQFFTKEDDVIRSEDIPERLLLRLQSIKSYNDYKDFITVATATATDTPSLKREFAEFVLNSIPALSQLALDELLLESTSSISDALEYLFDAFTREQLEVPFILSHRLDKISSLLSLRQQEGGGLNVRDLVWKIYDLYFEYFEYYKKCKQLEGLILSSNVDENDLLLQQDFKEDRLRRYISMDAINDLLSYYSYRYSSNGSSTSSSSSSGKRRRNLIAANYEKYNIREFLQDGYSLLPYHFVRNYCAQEVLYAPKDDGESSSSSRTELLSPEDYCLFYQHKYDLSDGSNGKTQSLLLLRITRSIYAKEILHDYKFMCEIRRKFAIDSKMYGLCKVNVDPIDSATGGSTNTNLNLSVGAIPATKAYSLCWINSLRDKPLKDFQREWQKWLMLEQAEEQQLVKVQFILPEREVLDEMRQYLLSDKTSQEAEQWNAVRNEVLQLVWKELSVKLCKYLRQQLHEYSQQRLKQEISIEYREKVVGTQPFAVKTYSNSNEQGIRPRDFFVRPYARVLALTCGAGDVKDASFGCLLHDDGQVQDTLKLNSIHLPHLKEKYAQDLKLLKKFLEDNYQSIDCCVVAGFGLQNAKIMEELRLIAKQVQQELQDSGNVQMGDDDGDYDDNGNVKEMPCFYLPRDDVCRIYMNSDQAKQEFPSFSPLLRYCVSVARCAQEPMFEYCLLFNRSEVQQVGDVCKLNLHELQHFLSDDEFYELLEREMIDLVNSVGADINRLCAMQYGQYVLQFVCGLGIRKASAILAHLRESSRGILHDRSQLVSEPIYMGLKVLTNCSAFLKLHYFPFPTQQKRSRHRLVEVLDATRIAPENYQYARKVAADAMKVEELPEGSENMSEHVEEVMRNMEYVRNVEHLDMHGYAQFLKQTKNEDKLHVLERIKEEICWPYRDVRKTFIPGTPDQVFLMFTGDNEIEEKQVVACVVLKVSPSSARVRLPSGVTGFIMAKNLSDKAAMSSNANANEFVKEGDTIVAKIVSVRKDKFDVELTARQVPTYVEPRAIHDTHWHNRLAEEKAADKSNTRLEAKRHFIIKRAIQHPLFHNYDFQQAEEYLAKLPPGEVLFRPSSQGTDYLSLTWKISDGVFQHIEIKESEKEDRNSLGRKLRIGDETFSDLDQIYEQYIMPMVGFSKSLINHGKFVRSSKEELEQHLQREIMANPKRIPYILGFSGTPGIFLLMYKTGVKEPVNASGITITPAGYKYKDKTYNDVMMVINAFKQFVMESSKPKAQSAPSNIIPAGMGQQPFRPMMPGMRPMPMNMPMRYPMPQQGQYYPPQPNPAYVYQQQRPLTMMPRPGMAPYMPQYGMPQMGQQRPPQPYGQMPPGRPYPPRR